MGTLVEYVQNLWPFSTLLYDDLRASDRIVKKLELPESTKNFVYAIREPESNCVIYILSVQNLSERSALDAESLIREVKPDAVVVQVSSINSSDIHDLLKTGSEVSQNSEGESTEGNVMVDEKTVPTSALGVLMKCFMHKMNKEKYENIAGNLVLREIFGVSFHEHYLVAKKAADEISSSFFMLESPYMKRSTSEATENDSNTELEVSGFGRFMHNTFGLQLSNFVPSRVGVSVFPLTKRPSCVTDDIQSKMMKSLSSSLACLNTTSKSKTGYPQPLVDYDSPHFANSFYPLLADMHDIFVDIPSMGTALASAQKMLCDVNKGEMVDTHLLSEVYAFQIAVEGLRIALNNAGRISKTKLGNSPNCEFSDLPMEDKSHAILAHALRSQAKKYKSIVAVVEASGLAGLRKHWDTKIPLDIENTVEELVTNIRNDGEIPTKRKPLLTGKPVVAIGAGASAIVGASSLSKVIPASTFVKIATFHVPSSLKLVLTQTQKIVYFAFGKGIGTTKVVAPKMATYALKSPTLNAIASAEKIRTVTHSVIASVEKSSLSAMRTAFYEIMRKRKVHRVGVLPWAAFGCSIATCSGLVIYGNGIECAVESVPIAPSIASLGRGIQSLHQVSEVVKKAESSRIQKSIEALLLKFKNRKMQ